MIYTSPANIKTFFEFNNSITILAYVHITQSHVCICIVTIFVFVFSSVICISIAKVTHQEGKFGFRKSVKVSPENVFIFLCWPVHHCPHHICNLIRFSPEYIFGKFSPEYKVLLSSNIETEQLTPVLADILLIVIINMANIIIIIIIILPVWV